MSKKRASQINVPPFLRELAEHAHAIDRIMHQPVRLHICSVLVDEDEISFKEMQTKTHLSRGNVSAQMTKLEHAGYLEVRKTFRGRRPATSYRLTPAGLEAWETYWSHVNALMEGLKAIGERKQAHWPGDA
jgi:DNA-binding MarR family transcriptional regulator